MTLTTRKFSKRLRRGEWEQCSVGLITNIDTPQRRRAPLALLNVKYGQPVELRVAQRTTEQYQAPPPKPMQAFEGSGQRLGAPAPEVVQGATTTAITNMPSSFATAASGLSPGPNNPAFEVDQSKPVTTVQVRLADGTK
jgi:UBX domain-containing protein 1